MQGKTLTDDGVPTDPLPPEAEMDRDDALRAFVAVCNVCQPDHPEYPDVPNGGPYPITEADVEFGVTRSYHAKCGPQPGWKSTEVLYDTRMTYIREVDRARHLALLIHEVTHIPHGHERGRAGHPPEFWREMAYHALLVRDSLRDGALATVFPDADPKETMHECVKDPNEATVDRRRSTVKECRETMGDLLGIEFDPDRHTWDWGEKLI